VAGVRARVNVERVAGVDAEPVPVVGAKPLPGANAELFAGVIDLRSPMNAEPGRC
jgi:hypothetical protein